ncbi:hypothetical protein YC2023_022722 [Brassica napus]
MPTCLLLTVWFLICILDSVHLVRAQNQMGATTHPDEAETLNSIFAAWKIPAQKAWNTSGDLCSGVAIDDRIKIDDKDYNPLIKCNCNFVNSTICRITALKVYAIDVVGPIPPQLWSLTYLTNLNLGQNYLTGSLSPAIGNLTRMEWMSFGINALYGPLPKEIGLLTNLKSLAIGVNNFSGSIPAEIGNCTKLIKIYIGNTGLAGEIPLSFANLVLLEDVSLGDIPNGSISLEFIKDMKSLSTLVFRNSNLTGTIPSNIEEYSSLQHVLEGLDKRDLPGLKCLQKNFPCNRGKGIYSDFLINCGGPQIRSVTGEIFEREDEDLGLASSFVSDGQRWAVSSVGLYARRINYIWVVNSLDSELFQSARHSSSSLRYYGLGLENGGYTVTLQFAEIDILGSNSWRGLGTRYFNIYVQGRLVEKDFAIRRTAGDRTISIPILGTYGPLISAITAKPDFKPTVANRPLSKKKYRTGTIVGVIVGLGLLSIFTGVVIFIIRKSRKRYTDDEELLNMDVKPYTFAYSELKNATRDFNPSNKLGEGGFGTVYKGNLNDGREIAVKVLSVGSKHGKRQFVAEIVAISAVMHRNLVKLYGCCYEGDNRLLVYEYLQNGSLDHALFGGDKTLQLNWPTRFEICMGVARGLAYLHEEASIRIIHRDVKASNILLDSNLLPKVSDFGLAKLYDEKETHMSTRVAGTIGYLAPEYAMRGYLTEKTDVYAFGIVVLELLSGRKNFDVNLENEKKYLLDWAWNLHENSREVELLDHELTEFNMEEAKRMIGISLLCTHSSHFLRPPMSRVVAMLSGDVEVSDITSKPGYLTDWRSDDTSSSSFSAFQTKDKGSSASNSTSFVRPRDGNLKQLGVKINEGR